MPAPLLLDAPDLPTAWKTLVPEYESAVYSPLVVKIAKWDPKYPAAIRDISLKRSDTRLQNYIDDAEMQRVYTRTLDDDDCSIRFGVKKEGHGYHGERGDFCLIGAAVAAVSTRRSGRSANVTFFYRSLELIGGIAYDITLMQWVANYLELSWRTVSIMSARAHVFALKGNSNEKLYPKLQKVFST